MKLQQQARHFQAQEDTSEKVAILTLQQVPHGRHCWVTPVTPHHECSCCSSGCNLYMCSRLFICSPPPWGAQFLRFSLHLCSISSSRLMPNQGPSSNHMIASSRIWRICSVNSKSHRRCGAPSEFLFLQSISARFNNIVSG